MSTKSEMASAPSQAPMPAPDRADADGSAAGTAGEEIGSTKPVDPALTNRPRKIIRNGYLAIEVSDYNATAAQLATLAKSFGGFVSAVNTYQPTDEQIEGDITLRIPSERFDTAVASVKRLGSRVTSETINAEDVTRSYYDLDARLKNARQTEARMQELLKSAKQLSDIVAIERELAEIRLRIEQLEGEQRGLDNQVSLSTLSVHVRGERPSGIVGAVGNAIEQGIANFTDVLAGVITFLIAGIPAFVAIFLIVWLLIKVIRRARGTK